MRLDETRIAIRERSLPDILDMSLRVIASYPGPLLASAVIVTLPMMLLNGWLLGWMPGTAEEPSAVMRYVWTMGALVFVEAPLASIVVTLFLGQAMFLDRINIRDMVSTLKRSWLSLFWCQLVTRGILLGWILLWLVERDTIWTGWETWFVVLTLIAAGVRAFRPFINEIVLLERNPLRSQGDYQITVSRRSRSLHGPNASDLMSRWIGVAVVAVLLFLSVFATIWYASGILTMNWSGTLWLLHLFFPLALWLTAAYVSVVRFLCYLDLRIRREGWEVELMLRAAAANLSPGATV